MLQLFLQFFLADAHRKVTLGVRFGEEEGTITDNLSFNQMKLTGKNAKHSTIKP